MRLFIITAFLLLLAPSVFAQDRLEMQGTSIIGNKELPKVLYIVPWKAADRINLTTPAYSSVLDEALRPMERSSFQRQVKYYQQLYPEQPVATSNQ